MRRHGGRSCAGCSLLLAFAGILRPAPVTADILDAMPAFVSRPLHAGIPLCAPHEELCPVSSGSNDLHCVDLTNPKTCGGCVVDGEGLDCTSVPDVFMQQCTSRGQCTGCRWKHGGMNASLEEPDFMSCSIVLTQPVQASRHRARRLPRLTFAKQLAKEKIARMGPMAARRPQNKYAADKAVAKHPPHAFDAVPAAQAYPGIGPGIKPLPPANARQLEAQRAKGALMPGGDAHVQPLLNPGQFAPLGRNRGLGPIPRKATKRDSFPAFELEDIPEPPQWLTAYTASQLSTLPLTESDDAILGWFQSIENGIVKLGIRFHAMSPRDQKKKISNADRFRLNLPPVPPKDLVRPNKPAPFIIPGLDYTEEEIAALGLQNYIKTKSEPEDEDPEETVTVYDSPSVFWGRLMKNTFASTPKTVRRDVMDALWYLLDVATRPAPPPAKKPAAQPKLPHIKAGEKLDAQRPFLQDAAKQANAAVKPIQQAFLRPGQLAAGEAARPDSNVLHAVKGKAPVAGAGERPKLDPIPLKPKAKPGSPIKKDGIQKAAPQLLPKAPKPQRPKADAGTWMQQRVDSFSEALEEHPELPALQKPKPAAERKAFADWAAFMDSEADNPYARERQRSPQKVKAKIGEQGKTVDVEDNPTGELAIPVDLTEGDYSQDSLMNEQSLLELLALKQQELADIRRKLLSEHKRKKPASDVSHDETLAKPKGKIVDKQSHPLNAGNKEQTAKKALLTNMEDPTPGKPLTAVKNPLLQPLGRQHNAGNLRPLDAQSSDGEAADVFEEHVRKAQKAKVMKLEDRIQPERLLEALRKEGLANGGDDVFARAYKKPMMAGMAKARPGAHLHVDSKPGRRPVRQ